MYDEVRINTFYLDAAHGPSACHPDGELDQIYAIAAILPLPQH
jgi:hypothetical protein